MQKSRCMMSGWNACAKPPRPPNCADAGDVATPARVTMAMAANSARSRGAMWSRRVTWDGVNGMIWSPRSREVELSQEAWIVADEERTSRRRIASDRRGLLQSSHDFYDLRLITNNGRLLVRPRTVRRPCFTPYGAGCGTFRRQRRFVAQCASQTQSQRCAAQRSRGYPRHRGQCHRALPALPLPQW